MRPLILLLLPVVNAYCYYCNDQNVLSMECAPMIECVKCLYRVSRDMKHGIPDCCKKNTGKFSKEQFHYSLL